MSAAAQYAPDPQQASWTKFKRCQACGRLYNASDIVELDGIELCMLCSVICIDALSRGGE